MSSRTNLPSSIAQSRLLELLETTHEPGEIHTSLGWRHLNAFAAAIEAEVCAQPIDMVLHCPACGLQHIDAPDCVHDHFDVPCRNMTAPEDYDQRIAAMQEWERTHTWTNPPHRSHLCASCGHIWRPADVPTNGVAAVKTKGKSDSPLAAHRTASTAAHGEAVAWRYRTKWVPAWITTTDPELVSWMRAQGHFEIESIPASPASASPEPERQERAEPCPKPGCNAHWGITCSEGHMRLADCPHWSASASASTEGAESEFDRLQIQSWIGTARECIKDSDDSSRRDRRALMAQALKVLEKADSALAPSGKPPASRVEGADMRAICEALGFDPTNHHNAAKCPYCRPAAPTLALEGEA